ncbi:MAG: hypothetical protein ABIH35_03550 [Patescibacteria group bacterium]
MFRKVAFVLLLAFSTTLLLGCFDGSEDSIVYEKREGVVRKLGTSIYQQGTHRLEQGGTLVALLEAAGPQIVLDNFVDREAEVEGIISATVEGNLEIMRVAAITPKDDAMLPGAVKYRRYSDDQFGFIVKYPSTLVARESRLGVAFQDPEMSEQAEKVIEIVVLENKLEQKLAEWLIDNYGYTADALTRVSVAGLSGYQFQNATGSVIYLVHNDQVFTLAWYDSNEDNRARNRRYYLELVQSLVVEGVSVADLIEAPQTTGIVAQDGDFCGGITGIECAGGLECRLSGSYPDAGGACVAQNAPDALTAVTSDRIAANSDLPEISAAELQRGWYYGDTDEKKPGTPATWIIVNPGTRSAMWRRLDEAAAEPEVSLPKATATAAALSADQKAVFDYLTINIAALAPEEATDGNWSATQFSFVKPNFVYAVYGASDSSLSSGQAQTRRLLFVYEVTDEGVTVDMQAYFRPGDEQDWLVIEGADLAFGNAQTIVNAGGELISKVVEGYRLFNDYGNGFSFQYPKDWYWRKLLAGRIEFSDKPFPAGLTLMTVRIVAGANYDFEEVVSTDDGSKVYLSFQTDKSVEITVDSGYEESLHSAAQSFEVK